MSPELINQYPYGEITFREGDWVKNATGEHDLHALHCLTVGGSHGFGTVSEAVDFMLHNKYKVSAHNLVLPTGDIIIVGDKNTRTNHAGLSCWGPYNKENGFTSLNGVSFGTEIIRMANEDTENQYTTDQYFAVAWLSKFYYGFDETKYVTHEQIRNKYIQEYDCKKDDEGQLRDHKGRKLSLKTDPDNFDMTYLRICHKSATIDGSIEPIE